MVRALCFRKEGFSRFDETNLCIKPHPGSGSAARNQFLLQYLDWSRCIVKVCVFVGSRAVFFFPLYRELA